MRGVQVQSPSLSVDALVSSAPYCQQEFTNGQYVAKYRCGHAVCTDCYDNAIHHGWFRCTLCRRSATTRYSRVIIIPKNNGDDNNGDDNNGDDLQVFIRPGSTTVTEPVASSDDVIPRHVVVENLIQHHRAKMDEHSEAIMELITQLSIHRDEYDEHKRLLQELLDEQARFHNPAASAAAAAVGDDDVDDEEVLDPIATYDNAAAAAATSVTITVRHFNHPMPLFPYIYVCKLPHGSDVNSVKIELLFPALCQTWLDSPCDDADDDGGKQQLG